MKSAFIPYGRQSISDQDIEAVVEVLRSDWLTQGPAVERFEKAVTRYSGALYAVAVNSGTSALHLACLAAGLGSEDISWTSPNTFVASANCGLYCGATVDFVDIDPRSYNMSVTALEGKLKKAADDGKLPKIVIPVHFSGQSCDMEQISELAKRYDFKVIEDACHAIGGRYQETSVGSCEFSDMTIFSFHPVKIVTTGEGGMVLTNQREIYEKLIRLRSHGITKDPERMQGKAQGPWYYQQIELGFNYRMTDIQAALGFSQMKSLEKFVKRRHLLADRYNQLLKKLPLTLPLQSPDIYSSHHLYVVRLKLAELKKTRLQVFEALRQAGIGVHVHYIPVHTQPYYQHLGFAEGDFPEAVKYYHEALSLPIYYDLSEASQNFIVETLIKVLQ